VKEAVHSSQEGKPLPHHLNSLALAIAPAVKTAQKQSGDLVDNTMRENVKNMQRILEKDFPAKAGSDLAKKLKIVGGVYHLETGKVEILDSKIP
jgi:carbonic anhydrase